jgi:glucose-1-phosphate thymidylyltransferase
VIESSVVGPHVSIGQDCHLERVVIRNSVIDEGSSLKEMVIKDALLGRHVQVEGQAERLNLGDHSWLMK